MKIVALMGEAGSGKDTILHSIMEKYPSYFNEIISCTTRPPREGEKEGVNYYFLSIDEFTKKVLNGDMLEATEFNDWHYGTDRESLTIDKINIGVFNPEGVRCLQEYDNIELYVFYVRAAGK
jgi:guanylate kinase